MERTEQAGAAPDASASCRAEGVEAAGEVAAAESSRRELLRTMAVGGGVLAAASLLRPSPLLAQTVDRTTPQLVRPSSAQLVTVEHGSVASTARPSGAGAVYWKGAVAPQNGVNGDLWYDTTGDD